MLGPYIKSRGTRVTGMSANADLTTVETYAQQGETIWKPVFHIWAKNNQTRPIFLSSYPLTHIYLHVN